MFKSVIQLLTTFTFLFVQLFSFTLNAKSPKQSFFSQEFKIAFFAENWNAFKDYQELLKFMSSHMTTEEYKGITQYLQKKNFNLNQPPEKITYTKDSMKFSNGLVLRVTADHKIFVKSHYFSKNKPLDLLFQEIDEKINKDSSLFQLFIPNAYAGTVVTALILLGIGYLVYEAKSGLNILEAGEEAMSGVVASCNNNTGELTLSLPILNPSPTVVVHFSGTGEMQSQQYLDQPNQDTRLALSAIFSECVKKKSKELSSKEIAKVAKSSNPSVHRFIKINQGYK